MPPELSLINPWIFVALTMLFGALMGSFVNAAIHRLPRNISMLTRTRSFCPSCEATIAWYDNLPILSFLLLRGRCRSCQISIPLRYLKVELLVATLFGLAAYRHFVLNAALGPFEHLIPLLITLAVIADLVCITFTDLETWYIPYETTFPFILLGLILAPFFPEVHTSPTPWTSSPAWDALIDSLQGLIVGAGVLWAIGFVTLVLIGKEGMGGGDAHLVGMLGAFFGWKFALLTIFLGIFIGSIIGIASILWNKYQLARLGSAWKKHQPAFELEASEEALGPPACWPYLVFGLFICAFEGFLLYLGQRQVVPVTQNILPLLGFLLGCLTCLAYPYTKRLIRQRIAQEGTWREGEIKTREDGKQEEVLQGNYIPFGPSLALAGLIVLFYDGLLRHYVFWWFFGGYGPEGLISWPQYLERNPLPVEILSWQNWVLFMLPMLLFSTVFGALVRPQRQEPNAGSLEVKNGTKDRKSS